MLYLFLSLKQHNFICYMLAIVYVMFRYEEFKKVILYVMYFYTCYILYEYILYTHITLFFFNISATVSIYKC